MKLGEFERQSLQGLREAVREVYREAMRNNQKVVVGDYKGNPRLIDPSEAFKRTTHRRRVLKKLRSSVPKKAKCAEKESNKSCFVRIGVVHCSNVSDKRSARCVVRLKRTTTSSSM
jgi:glutamine synthetase type III